MKSRFLIVLALLLMMTVPVYADIIIFKDGRMINVRVIQQDESQMKVEENGEEVTYEKDQIQSINGKPVASLTEKTENTEDQKDVKVAAIQDPEPSGLSKRALIRKFLDVFGTRQMMTQNFEQMIASLPQDKAKDLQKILNVDEIIDNIMPLYDKYFTQEDLEAYVAFYSSERGQKFLKILPVIMQESVAVNIEYFKTKMPEAFQ